MINNKKKIITIAITALSINAFAQIPTVGLVGHYPFTGNANDLSGNSNNGTMNNGATYAADRFGNPNSAALLDGVDDYIALPSGSATSLNITGDLTVSFWIKTTDNSGGLVVTGDVVSSPPTAAGYLSGINGGNAGNGNVGVSTRGNWNGSVGTVNDNNWHHITYIQKSDTLRIYIDNVLDNQLTGIQTPLTWSGNRVIGCRHDLFMSSASNYAGSFDDLRIYNIALTTSNVNSLFNEGVCFQTVYDTVTVYDTTYVTITDTNYVTITDTVYISVTDTLIINTTLTGINPPNNTNTVKVYPNPASTHIYIDNGNYSLMNGYTVRIDNSLSQTVFTSPINQQQFYIDLSSWSGNGTYFVYVIDNLSNIIEVRKIILQ